MPRLTNRPPAYRLHKPSGQARVRYNGHEYWLGKFGTPESKEAYARLVAELSSSKDDDIASAPTGSAPPALSIAELIQRYWVHAQSYYVRDGKLTGEHIVIRAALRPVLKMFGSTPAVEFGPKRLKLVREEMIRLGWSRHYINDSVGRVKRMFTWCASEELLPAAVAMALRTVQGLQKDRTGARETPPVGPVSDEHLEAVLPVLPSTVADMVRVQRLTGCRPGELLATTAEAIDRSDPTCWEFRPSHHKTAHHDRDRVVFIGPRCQAILMPYIARAGGGRVFRHTRDGYRRAITRACERVGISTWHPNQLRHALGTEVRKKFGLEASQVILGHARADFTQVYAETNADRGREVARLVG
jgi:integrase